LAILKSSFRAKGFEQSDDSIKLYAWMCVVPIADPPWPCSMVEQCFEQADLDRNGSLDFDEFKQAVLQHQVCCAPLTDCRLTRRVRRLLCRASGRPAFDQRIAPLSAPSCERALLP
jgi:hypothetical protein